MKTALTFDDILLTPAYNNVLSRKDTSLKVTSKCGKLSLQLPVFSANMSSITEHGMANFMLEQGGMGVLHRFLSIEENIRQYKLCSKGRVFVSVGVSDAELERATALFEAGAQFFCIDVAHAHAHYVAAFMDKLRGIVGLSSTIMVGNVATAQGVEFLRDAGADIVKVGIGGGSVCSTRIKTGFGVPTLQSILDCKGVPCSIVADGGIRTPGDIVKALALGADFVMLGGMLAGTGPTPGPVKARKLSSGETLRTKTYSGMASKEAQEEYFGKMDLHKTAEGISLEVPARDDQYAIMQDIRGGLRSGLTYGGCSTIKELQQNIAYKVVSQAGQVESHPHKLKGA